MTGVVGSILEAWGEVRVHRARVVLSLVGVVLAVFAMTIVTAGGTLARQVVLEANERMTGRDTTVTVYAYPEGDEPVGVEQITAALGDLVDRYGVEYSSLVVSSYLDTTNQSTGPGSELQLVEPDYGVIHRLEAVSGRWFTAADADRMAPAAVVNTRYLREAGMEGAVPPFAITLPGEPEVTATVVGVVDRYTWGPQVTMLTQASAVLPVGTVQNGSTSLELWVPPELAETIVAEVPAVLAARGITGDVSATSDELLGIVTAAQWGVRGLSWFALCLGALGVLNVGIVTVRQRVREIGVRRALGASSGRVFAAVVLESVCATVAAGLIGIALAVALVVNLPLDRMLGDYGISDVPGFPASAAVEALVAATVVGALVGLVPATMAVRSKVIDAIRY